MYRQGAAELGICLWVPDDARVLGIPVVQAADIGLDHADSCLGCSNGLYQAACAGLGPSAKQLFLLQEHASCTLRWKGKTFVGMCRFFSSMRHSELGSKQ